MFFHWRRYIPLNQEESLGLVGLPILTLVFGYLYTCLSRGSLEWESLRGAIAVLCAFVFASRYPKKRDPILLFIVLSLVAAGWTMLERLDPALAWRQSIWIVIAVVLRAVVPLNLLAWCKGKTAIFCLASLAVGLQAAVFVAGTEKNGAKNWLMLGSFSTQPGEFVKLLLILFLAALFCQYRNWLRIDLGLPKWRFPHPSTFAVILIWVAVEATFVIQKDLGMALLTALIFLAMFYVATGRVDVLALCVALGGVGSAAAYYSFPHVRERFEAWLDPFSDPLGTGYQSVQALYAVASGGLFGRGLGRGEPDLVPEAPTDFMSAALCEEFGLLGFLAVLLLLCLLVARAYGLALESSDEFGSFLAFGIGTSFAAQILLVTGGCFRLLPLTGLTLPFLSYGGSSLLASFLSLILIERVSLKAVKHEG